MNDTNYYMDALEAANNGADVDGMLDLLEAAQRELNDLRWQLDQADAYGSHMRHCLHPVTFAEWIARQRHLLAGKTMPAAELIDRLRERGNGVQP